MSQYCGEDLSIKYERNNNISYAVVDITDSNELVEPFEGASGAVVQFIDDGFDAGLVGGDGVRLGR